MVTYDEVKTKIVDFRKRVLADMTYKRAERAKTLFDGVNATVKYILEQISAALSAKTDLNVDTYNAQLYYLSAANPIGEKKVSVDYADSTTTIDGRTVIPFDSFSYDYSGYIDNVKGFADALSRRIVMFRSPISETPPGGDFEDATYIYYTPSDYQSAYQFTYDLYVSFGAEGKLHALRT